MGITELAERLGTTHRALRYYEQMELITPDRNAQGVRSYDARTRQELELIVILRRTGHSLKDIRAVLPGEDANADDFSLRIATTLMTKLNQLNSEVEQVKGLLVRFGQPTSS